ncbi:hypothetical protein CH333_01910 [candidate division WOR-3 bacterium JGI_Cruoil_03_44_89]|uniref:Glycosyl transferase family 1 domain-containing protein n=1 Tax=candidate division WOR-3 bacterium JGI_Cruoil_03_44_89 TaxID=1973748 RepID=A0A235BZA7_UNCW3|nr:MAG: hypothetical protein CH333_01910 [candidate division WOR-3 bacterium JGI_Cruoil_03_44_89]
MRTVAYFINKYLQLSETFIYNEITHIKRFHPIVIAKNILNRDVFPFEDIFLWERNKIEYILREHKAVLIHAHFGGGGIMVLPVALKLGIPIIVEFHGIDTSRYPRYFVYRRRLKKLFEKGNCFIAVSEDMKNDLVKLGCEEEKIRVCYIGIDVDKFSLKHHRVENINKIVMCGRFVEKKGFEYGIKAYARMKNKNTRLIIIGDGKLMPQMKEVVESLKLSSSVDFLGFCSHDRVKEELKRADIFLAPHVTARNGDKEGIPNTIKEAMATGLPVVSTYHSGIPELVKDGRSGFLVNERDVEGMSRCLEKLLDNPGLREEMGKRGRQMILEKFTLEGEIEELEEIYESNVKRL